MPPNAQQATTVARLAADEATAAPCHGPRRGELRPAGGRRGRERRRAGPLDRRHPFSRSAERDRRARLGRARGRRLTPPMRWRSRRRRPRTGSRRAMKDCGQSKPDASWCTARTIARTYRAIASRSRSRPSLAFGTGHHGTTRGCLLALDRMVKLHRRGKNQKAANRRRPILDIGTGTGVLAIAAARALRCRVMASDIDPVAVRVARANARLNRASGFVETRARGRPGGEAPARAPTTSCSPTSCSGRCSGWPRRWRATSRRVGGSCSRACCADQANAALAS